MNYSIGIDIHKASSHYQIQNPEGQELDRGRLPNSSTGWSKFLNLCQSQGLDPTQTAVFVEATGRYHLPWCQRLHEEGFQVYVLNPLLTKRLYSSANAIRDQKTDPVDAATLCEIGRIYAWRLERFRYRPQPQKLSLQNLVSSRKSLRKQCTNLLKAAGHLLDLIFPEAKETGLTLTHSGFRQLLLQAPTPRRLKTLQVSTIQRLVGEKAEQLQQAAANSIIPDSVAEPSSPALVHLLESINALLESIEKANQAIEQACSKLTEESKQQRLLRSLPKCLSVGPCER